MVKISDLNFSVETPTLDLTPAPLDVTTNLPIEDSPSKPLSSMKLREVSSPKLGKYAGLGLINLTSSAGQILQLLVLNVKVPLVITVQVMLLILV